jgi:hypothetical protein
VKKVNSAKVACHIIPLMQHSSHGLIRDGEWICSCRGGGAMVEVAMAIKGGTRNPCTGIALDKDCGYTNLYM